MMTNKQIVQTLAFAKQLSIRDLSDDSAFITLMRICRDYIDVYEYPLVTGEERDKWLAERLKKYRIRYVEKI
jgi:hypothetical protein